VGGGELKDFHLMNGKYEKSREYKYYDLWTVFCEYLPLPSVPARLLKGDDCVVFDM